MGLKKQIRQALHTIGETEYKSKLVSGPVFIKDTQTFFNLTTLLGEFFIERKKLKKENKKLKKELKEGKLPGYAEMRLKTLSKDVAFHCSPVNRMTSKPVAEFKCANTNKPSKEGRYLCVVKSLYYQYRNIWYSNQWDQSETEGLDVIAFTETSPEDILKNLK